MRIHGFYRVIDSYPAPVVPLFRDDTTSSEFAQIISVDGKIEAFCETGHLERSRTLVEGEYSQTDVKVGDPAIYALAYDENHVLVNTAEVVRREIRQYLYENRDSLGPFLGLDLAKFVGDTALIEENAERCRRKLVATAPAVTALWIDGAPLSEELKSKLRNRQIDLDGSAPPRAGTVRLGLIGPYRIMTGITDYCTQAQHAYRADIVRRLLSYAGAAKRITQSSIHIEDVVSSLSSYYKVNHGRAMFSRGRIPLMIFDIASFQIARQNFRHAIQATPSYATLASSAYFTRGAESANLIMLICVFLHAFPDFQDFYGKMLSRR